MVIPCSDLPNPHTVPALRPRHGTHWMVRDWLTEQPGVTDFINHQVQRVLTEQPTSIVTTCSAGKHRSVMIAEALSENLEQHGVTTTITHRELNKKKRGTITEQGLGWKHQKTRNQLLAKLRDGTPCEWCGRPMHRNQQLDADHEDARHNGGTRASRLLHAPCNRQRMQGHNDRRAPIHGAPDAFPMRPITLKTGDTDTRYSTEKTAGRAEHAALNTNPFKWG